jgi:hypothetical protein
MSDTLVKLKELCRSEHLDILVQDQKMQAANAINSEGMDAQVRYLLTRMSEDELVKTVEHEMKTLRKYGMKSQSKLPEGNVKRKQ